MIHLINASNKSYLWGGTRLKTRYGKIAPEETIAESWELSCHPDGPSVLSDLGITLEQYLQQFPEKGGTALGHYDRFPVLVKLIDAKKDLSVQVHPDDAYALAHEGQLGKTEMWYIVDCEPGAHIYYGFREPVSPGDFAKHLEEGTLSSVLRRMSVKKGELYFIPAGTVHSIGAGCLIAEVQENSNVTYRVDDFGRKDKDGHTRALHLEQAKAVSDLTVARTDWDFGGHLVKTDYFVVDVVEPRKGYKLDVSSLSFVHVMILESETVLSHNGESRVFKQGDSVFVDADSGVVALSGGKVMLTRLDA